MSHVEAFAKLNQELAIRALLGSWSRDQGDLWTTKKKKKEADQEHMAAIWPLNHWKSRASERNNQAITKVTTPWSCCFRNQNDATLAIYCIPCSCRKIWEAFLDNEVLLNGERVKKKSTSVRRVSVCPYHRVLGLREQLLGQFLSLF